MRNPFNRPKEPVEAPVDAATRAQLRQEAIDSYIANRTAKNEAQEEARYAGLSEEEKQRTIAYWKAMDNLASAAAKNSGRTTPRGDNMYLRYMEPDTQDGIGIARFSGFVLAAAVLLGGGTTAITASNFNTNDGAQYLEELGYTDVEHTSSSYLLPNLAGCDINDLVAYRYDATAPNGATNVDQIVCKGLFKGATARRG